MASCILYPYTPPWVCFKKSLEIPGGEEKVVQNLGNSEEGQSRLNSRGQR